MPLLPESVDISLIFASVLSEATKLHTALSPNFIELVLVPCIYTYFLIDSLYIEYILSSCFVNVQIIESSGLVIVSFSGVTASTPILPPLTVFFIAPVAVSQIPYNTNCPPSPISLAELIFTNTLSPETGICVGSAVGTAVGSVVGSVVGSAVGSVFWLKLISLALLIRSCML